MATRKTKKRLYLISDASGSLLEHFSERLLTQFPDDLFEVESIPFQKTPELAHSTVRKLRRGAIVHGITDPRVKAAVNTTAQERGLPCFDATGDALQFLELFAGKRAERRTELLHQVDANYLDRMTALEFALQHDDSRRLEQIGSADIVIVGVSRVSKSPTALFLGYRGFRAANVSIVPDHGLPAPLAKHRKKNVVAFTVQPKRLAEIRARRFADWRIQDFNYTDLRDIQREVRAAEQIYERKGWPVIDTTWRTVEETAALLLKSLGLKWKSFH